MYIIDDERFSDSPFVERVGMLIVREPTLFSLGKVGMSNCRFCTRHGPSVDLYYHCLVNNEGGPCEYSHF